MNKQKNKEKKTFSCYEELVGRYFPSESKKKESILIDNPKLLGEYFANQVLKQVKI